jgi:hypothetical protein
MKVLGFDLLGPHAFWGWAFEVAAGGFALLVICFVLSLASQFGDASRTASARREYLRSSQHIDELYRQAETEVRRLGQ